MSGIAERNAFTREFFPEHWDDEDIAFLAKFLNEQLDAKLVADLEADTTNDYRLLVDKPETQSRSVDTPGVVDPVPSRIDPPIDDPFPPGDRFAGLGQGIDVGGGRAPVEKPSDGGGD